jgi:predicted house-cleaning noncanonical NTP pyrophosphatase (MazG superfamily)
MMKRNPVVRDLIAKPRRNAGKHSDKRAVMIEDLTNVRAELEQEVRDLIDEMKPKDYRDERRAELLADVQQLQALVDKLNQVQSEIEEFDDEQ